MGTHLRMNTQVLSGAQSQPQKWQLLALLFLIEVEQLSKLFNHLCQQRREGKLGLSENTSPCPTRPQPPKHNPQAMMATTGESAKSGECAEHRYWLQLTFSISGTVLEQQMSLVTSSGYACRQQWAQPIQPLPSSPSTGPVGHLPAGMP